MRRWRDLCACATILVAVLLNSGQLAASQDANTAPPAPAEKQPSQDAHSEPAEQQHTAPYSMRVNVPRVSLDVSVLTENGYFVPDLKKDNFHVFEDGVPQAITSFSERHAPITAVLLVEFTADTAALQLNALLASYRFSQTLRNDDWSALILFDRELRIALDFTQNKSALQETLTTTRVPLSREINLFDALIETLDRLEQVEGRKYILLMASGQDTLSKAILDDVLKRLERAKDTVIFSIDTGHGLHHLQADNQMGVFARMTGGRLFFPVAQSEYEDAFREIGQSIRNHYVMSYRPSNALPDGRWRKIKVTVVNPANSAPGSKEDIGRKYQIFTREGYRADSSNQ